jgi:hypothetical protein
MIEAANADSRKKAGGLPGKPLQTETHDDRSEQLTTTLRQLLAQLPDGLLVRREMMVKVFLSTDKVNSVQ